MCGNRVEELEARVKELEASVEGLTDELVECKVRLRELENTVDEDTGFGADAHKSASGGTPDRTGDSETAPESEPEPEPEEADDGGDIIVPETGADRSNTEAPDGADREEAGADEETETESEESDDSGSDIIVA